MYAEEVAEFTYRLLKTANVTNFIVNLCTLSVQ